jgi:hypothetical protein
MSRAAYRHDFALLSVFLWSSRGGFVAGLRGLLVAFFMCVWMMRLWI